MIELFITDPDSYQDTSIHGDYVLTPLNGSISNSINSNYEATLTLPYDENGIWKLIECEQVIKMQNWNGYQFYRIKQISKSESEIELTMLPIAYDLALSGYVLFNKSETSLTGDEFLDLLRDYKNDSKLSFDSDTWGESVVVSPDALSVEDTNVINWLFNVVDDVGGEVYFDASTIYVVSTISNADRGHEFIYGRDFKVDGITIEEDWTDVITCLYPYTANFFYRVTSGSVEQTDGMVSNFYSETDEAYLECSPVYSSRYEDYKMPYIGSTTLSNIYAGWPQVYTIQGSTSTEAYESLNDLIAEANNDGSMYIYTYDSSSIDSYTSPDGTRTSYSSYSEARTAYNEAVVEACEELFNDGLDTPAITITIDYFNLQNVVGYQNYKNKLSFSLGEIVTIKNTKFNFETTARVTELTYDPIKEEISSLSIGSIKKDYLFS